VILGCTVIDRLWDTPNGVDEFEGRLSECAYSISVSRVTVLSGIHSKTRYFRRQPSEDRRTYKPVKLSTFVQFSALAITYRVCQTSLAEKNHEKLHRVDAAAT
jgi:hypothetical protein